MLIFSLSFDSDTRTLQPGPNIKEILRIKKSPKIEEENQIEISQWL